MWKGYELSAAISPKSLSSPRGHPAISTTIRAHSDIRFLVLRTILLSRVCDNIECYLAQAGHPVKLDVHKFLETFDECWTFVVRCEIICRRMIVGLRGAVLSQAKSFLQAFHQARICQFAKLVDARYLHEKFTILKTAGAPTTLLKTLVADKRVTTVPISTRPTTPTPPSPLPPPPSNVPLGGAGRPATTLTNDPRLSSNECIKGTLSCNNTATPAPVPVPVPVPAPAPEEKQGGFKQVVVPLGASRKMPRHGLVPKAASDLVIWARRATPPA